MRKQLSKYLLMEMKIPAEILFIFLQTFVLYLLEEKVLDKNLGRHSYQDLVRATYPQSPTDVNALESFGQVDHWNFGNPDKNEKYLSHKRRHSLFCFSKTPLSSCDVNKKIDFG